MTTEIKLQFDSYQNIINDNSYSDGFKNYFRFKFIEDNKRPLYCVTYSLLEYENLNLINTEYVSPFNKLKGIIKNISTFYNDDELFLIGNVVYRDFNENVTLKRYTISI